MRKQYKIVKFISIIPHACSVEYKNIEDHIDSGSKISIAYPNHFDIENVNVYVEDSNGHHASILINAESELGKQLVKIITN